jgi:hypothetical protein
MAMVNSSDTVTPTEPAATATAETPAATPVKKKVVRLVPKPKPKRVIVQSTIGFPYRDLENGVSVAQAIHNAGAVALSTDQLAGVMGLQAGSGNFVLKVGAARSFGLVSYSASKYELTDLGFEITEKDEKRQKAAKAKAFLTVPLYRRTYDDFRGRQLPPRLGLEQAFVRYGVSPKQKEAARQAFEKSASQAGFFTAGSDRLVEPIIAGIPSSERSRVVVDEIDLTDENNPPASAPAAKSKPNDGLHPFIQGLLGSLPEPNTNWTVEGRATWLQAASKIFDLIYKGSGEITIVAKGPDAPKQ